MRYENKTFDRGEVVIDGGDEFVHCQFQNCVLVFTGGPITTIGCQLQNIEYGLRGPAAYTAMFFARLRADDPQAFEKIMQQALEAGLGNPSSSVRS